MDKQTQKYLLYAGGYIAAYYLIIKPVLQTLGIKKTAEQIRQGENVNTFITQTLSRQKPTKSVGEWQIIANQIYEDLKYTALDDNKQDAFYQIQRVKNDADVATLIRAFGTRREFVFGIPAGSPKDLQQFITSNLSRTQISQINDNYRRKGIKYRF